MNLMKSKSNIKLAMSSSAFSGFEVDIQKDVVILSIARAVLYVAKKEGKKSSIYLDERKVYYDTNNPSIGKIEALIEAFISKFDSMESGIKRREFASIICFKEKANDIYIKTLIDKRFDNNFNLEIFAINLIVSRFIDRAGLSDRKRISTSRIMEFVDFNFINFVSATMASYFDTDDFVKEYTAASIVCEEIQQLKH